MRIRAIFGQRIGEADDSVRGEARQNLAGERLGDRADPEQRIDAGRLVRIVGAATEALDRRLPVADDAEDERRHLERQEQDWPGEVDRFVEQGLACLRGARPRQGRSGEKAEDVASPHHVPQASLRRPRGAAARASTTRGAKHARGTSLRWAQSASRLPEAATWAKARPVARRRSPRSSSGAWRRSGRRWRFSRSSSASWLSTPSCGRSRRSCSRAWLKARATSAFTRR